MSLALFSSPLVAHHRLVYFGSPAIQFGRDRHSKGEKYTFDVPNSISLQNVKRFKFTRARGGS